MTIVNWIRIFVIDPRELFGQPDSNFRIPEPVSSPPFLKAILPPARERLPTWGPAPPRTTLSEAGSSWMKQRPGTQWVFRKCFVVNRIFFLMFQPVLVRMWRNWSTCALVVGVWTSAALWKMIWNEGSSKIKSELPDGLIIPHMPQRIRRRVSNRYCTPYWQQHYSLQAKGEGNPDAHLCKDDGWAWWSFPQRNITQP